MEEMIKLVKQHGLQFIMAILCLWLLLGSNEERKMYLKELTETRIEYINSLNKVTNRLESIDKRLNTIEVEVRRK